MAVHERSELRAGCRWSPECTRLALFALDLGTDTQFDKLAYGPAALDRVPERSLGIDLIPISPANAGNR